MSPPRLSEAEALDALAIAAAGLAGSAARLSGMVDDPELAPRSRARLLDHLTAVDDAREAWIKARNRERHGARR